MLWIIQVTEAERQEGRTLEVRRTVGGAWAAYLPVTKMVKSEWDVSNGQLSGGTTEQQEVKERQP